MATFLTTRRMSPELRRQFPPEWTENLHKYLPKELADDLVPKGN